MRCHSYKKINKYYYHTINRLFQYRCIILKFENCYIFSGYVESYNIKKQSDSEISNNARVEMYCKYDANYHTVEKQRVSNIMLRIFDITHTFIFFSS